MPETRSGARDTIYALASARGRAGVAVVRLSGPLAWEAVARLAGTLPPVRELRLRRLVGEHGVLDEALVVVFPAGASFTGELTAELHLHGSTAVVAGVLGELGVQPGLRVADAGEFTRRALENGRLDLAQVEGLADLIDAETEAQRRQALRVLEGAIGRLAASWRERLVETLAFLEAAIDFAEEDVPQGVSNAQRRALESVAGEMERELRGAAASERVREGFEVAIVGPPNSGKSTLINYLAGRDAAITSEFAGTTRDVIEVRMDVAGLAVSFLDTAGLRDGRDPVERLGIERARERALAADLRLHLLGGPEERPLLEVREGDLVVLGKADLHPDWEGLSVSGSTGQGIGELVDALAAVLGEKVAGASLLARVRQRQAVEKAQAALVRALGVAAREDGEELVAEEIRASLRALDFLVGRVDVEELLGEIFSRFCIGK